MTEEEIRMSLDEEIKIHILSRCTLCITNATDSMRRRVGYLIMTDKQQNTV